MKFRLRNRHLLFMSLVINLFLVGILFGNVMKPPFPPHKKHHDRMSFEGLAKNLPEDKAQLIKDEMESLRSNNNKIFDEMKKSRKEIIKALTAEEFDPEEYHDAISDMNEIRNNMMENFSDAISSVANELSYEERKTLAKNLKEMEPRRGKWGK